jgi:hypothetical protein
MQGPYTIIALYRRQRYRKLFVKSAQVQTYAKEPNPYLLLLLGLLMKQLNRLGLI